MPRTPEQYDAIREKRKEQIMETALELFSSEGYAHVSIASLAKHAGISKGLMYNYFKSKDHLLTEILDHSVKEILAYFDPNNDGVLTREEFELFIRKTFELMRDNQEYYRRFFALLIQPNISEFFKKSAMIKFMEKYFSMFEAYFRKLGFEDPLLEVFQLAVIIEGLGAMIVFYNDMTPIPKELYDRFEERIIKQYT